MVLTATVFVPSDRITMVQSRATGFHDLPYDVVHEIFSLASNNDPEWAPVVISHCCRGWREDSLNTPLLWNRITFRKSFPMRSEEEFSLKQKAWITRSKQAPLHIAIGNPARYKRYVETPPAFGERSISRILKLILPECYRWESLSIDDIGTRAWRTVYDKLRYVDAPLLLSLELFALGELRQEEFKPFRNGAGASNVRDLKVGSGVEPSQWEGHLFQSLTAFTFGQIIMPHEYSDYHPVLPFLSNNPDLERLTLTWHIPDYESPPPFPPSTAHISLSKLVEITFIETLVDKKSFGAWPASSFLLLSLDAPNLTNIYPPHFDTRALNMLAFAPRIPFANIQHFGVSVVTDNGDDIDPAELAKVLLQLRSLRSFRLDYGRVPDEKVRDWLSLIISPFCEDYPLLDTLIFYEQYSSYAAAHLNTYTEHTFIEHIVEERRLHPLLKSIDTLDIGSMLISQQQKAWFAENVPQFVHQERDEGECLLSVSRWECLDVLA